MKLKNYLIAFATISFIAGFSSCKKDSSESSSDEPATTVELSGDQAISDKFNIDAENVLNEAAVTNNFAGNTPVSITETTNILSCAAVTVTPLQGFPKVISIDFGASGCTSPDGVTRKGKINITLDGYLRDAGTIAVMTFDNYYVSDFKKEGTVTWTNKSQNGVKIWERKCENGKITAPVAVGGRFWLHNGTQTVTQTAGSDSPFNLLDDIYSTTGSATVTNAAGTSRTAEIIIPLEKKVSCGNIDKGSIKISGPSHYALIDFGDGTCDAIATISVDGKTPISFPLL